MAQPLFLLKYAGKVIVGATGLGLTIAGAVQQAAPDPLESFIGKLKLAGGLTTIILAGTYKV